jgi:hypothetical protein
MKIFGSWKELLSLVFRKDGEEVTLRPNQSTTYTDSRDIQLPPGDAAHVLTSADSTQTFTNKTLNAAVVSTYTEFDDQASDPSAPSGDDVRLYAKDKKLYTRTADAISELGGGGSGEINVIDNPNDATAGWAASGAGITVATTTTGSDLPLSGVFETAIKITPVSDTDYVYYRWTMPAALKHRKLKVEWHQRPLSGYASGDLKVEVYKNDQSDYAGSYTEFSLSTDSSGTSSIPNQTGKYTTAFDADDGDYYELRIVRTAGTTALNIVSVIVGPGIQPQGAVVTAPELWTPTGSWSSNTVYSGVKWREGNFGVYEVRIDLGGAPTSADLTINLPAGETIDNTYLLSDFAAGQGTLSGVASILDAGTEQYDCVVQYNDTTSIMLRPKESLGSGAGVGVLAGVNATNPITFANGDKISIQFRVPINEFRGSGTVNLAQNDVEYAYNTDTANSSDTSSFGYGPGGVQFGSYDTATRVKRVRFQTPIQPTDLVRLELTEDGGTTWTSGAGWHGRIVDFADQAGTSYGWSWASVSATDVDVSFYRYRTFFSGGVYGAAGTAWSSIAGSSSIKWRMVKVKGGAAIGFGIVSETSSGLMPASNTNLDNAAATRLGLKTYYHGTTYNGGNAPTVTLSSGGGTLSSVDLGYFKPYQDQSGDWFLEGNVAVTLSSASRTAPRFAIAGISMTGGDTFAGYVIQSGVATEHAFTESSNLFGIAHPSASTTGYRFSFNVKLSAKPTWAY